MPGDGDGAHQTPTAAEKISEVTTNYSANVSQNYTSQLHPARMLQPEVLYYCKTHGCSRVVMHGGGGEGQICAKA